MICDVYIFRACELLGRLSTIFSIISEVQAGVVNVNTTNTVWNQPSSYFECLTNTDKAL